MFEQKSPLRFKYTFQQSPIAIELYDPNGLLIDVNMKYLEMFGLSDIQKIIGSRLFDDPNISDELKQKISLGEVVKFEREIDFDAIKKMGIYDTSKSGHIYVDCLVSTWEMEGANRGYLVHVMDITEHKHVEKRYRDLFENANEAMYTHDLTGNFRSINKIGLKLLGATEDEIIGSNIKEWLAPQSYDVFKDRVRKIILNQPLEQPVVVEVITKNGEHKWGEVTTRLIKEGNRTIEVHGICRDITERISLQKELKESEEKYRDLFENANDAMYTQDLEGRIITMNEAGLKITGCTRAEMIGSNFAEWITPETIKIGQDILERIMSGEVVTEPTKLKIFNKKGETRWVEFTIRLIRKNNKITGIHGIGRDVTDLERAKEELKALIAREQAALAEAAAERELNRMKSVFLSITSHELRTPLNSILGFTGIILEGWSGELNPEQKEQLGMVQNSAKQLLMIINDVIDLSMIESGKLMARVCEFSLKDVVDEAVLSINANLLEKGLTMSVEVEDIHLKTDKKRVLQCITNLLSNAVKFSEIGNIKITARIIENMVHISVTDTGIGIRAEDTQKLFLPFERLESPLRLKTSGMGLGLYITKKLAINILGGDVFVKSEPGKGSTFTMQIPAEIG